ncbi:MAG TPA: AMP-binding protein [Candidatus Lokiarchaeia archaeon]|nr:AMP-binding protein [Candidatus Lokiarchaeia archaeon]
MSERRFRINRNTLLRDIIKNYAEIVGDRTFLTYVKDFDNGIDETYTFKDIHVMSNKIGNGLLSLGLNKGDGIALMDVNSPAFLLSVFGGFKIGTYTILVNTGLKGESLRYILDHSDAKAIIINWRFLEEFMKIKGDLPKLTHIIVDDDGMPVDAILPESPVFLRAMEDEASEENITASITPADMCMLMYTAGTTGLPKGIMFWQGKLLGGYNLQALSMVAKFLVRPNDVLYTPLPLFHSNALFLSSFAAYINKVPLILAEKFSASRHWDICRRYNVTTFNMLGAMASILMKQPERPDDKDHQVSRIYSAACPMALWLAFEERFGTKLEENYGATDGGGFALYTFGFKDVPVGTMGKPMGGVVVEIQDEDGTIVHEPGAIGELVFLVRENEKDQRAVTYYKDEESSENLIQRGAEGQLWFHTGDLAYKDQNGWLFYVDRKKDMIRRRGENIASLSIENVILQNEKILEVAAYGVKTELGEDDVMVSIVLKPDMEMTPDELVDFCNGKMADFMIPRFIRFVDALPKNEVHRVLKAELKETGVTPDTFDREQQETLEYNKD